MNRALQIALDDLRASPLCGARGVYDAHRPHTRYRMRKGRLVEELVERVRWVFRCQLEPGHSGPHRDLVQCVGWKQTDNA